MADKYMAKNEIFPTQQDADVSGTDASFIYLFAANIFFK